MSDDDDDNDNEELEENPRSARARKVVGGAKRVVSAAAIRTGASQVVKKSKAAMAAMLANKIDPENKGLRKKLAVFLDKPEGEAMLAGLLSIFTLPASRFDDDGEPLNGVAKLGAELQTAALHKISDEWIDQLTAPLMMIASQMFGKEVTAIASNVRVAADAIENGEKAEPEEADRGEGRGEEARTAGQHKKATAGK